MYRNILISFALFIVSAGFTHAEDLQLELNGFLLHQYKDAVGNTLGTPFKTIETGYSTAEAYLVDEQAYMVFEFLNERPHTVHSIQLTGSTNNMRPFKGLRVGDSLERVIQALGPPDTIYQIINPPVSRYEYDDRNYSIEIDEQSQLYSIRIGITAGIFAGVSSDSLYWETFKQGVLQRDLTAIFECLRPDVEIYKDGQTLSIDKAFISFTQEPSELFYKALLDSLGSVFQELQTTESEEQIRLLENVGVGRVHKFHIGAILKEIVFFPYGGRYRVYEIAFR